MNRRNFFKSLGSFVASAGLKINHISYDPVKQKIVIPTHNNECLIVYKGHDFFNSGYVYAPYIPKVRP